MIEPSLEIGGEFKPLSQLNKSETETLYNKLLEKMDAARNIGSYAIQVQIGNFMTMAENRMELFDSGMIIDTPKETGERRTISILDDDF